MTRPFLMLLIALAAAVAAAPLAAQELPPRFFIERIEVRDYSRVSPEVVIAESRLREGAEYTESELRDAAARLARLPFLLTAEFSLERGSERGQHVLVITISETRSFFYRLDFVPILTPGSVNVSIDNSNELGNDDTSATLGYRWFLGRRGALHVAVLARESTEFTEGYSAIAVGYTQYDLFGTRAFATINLKDRPDSDSSLTPQVVVGIPLSLNQTLTAEYDEIHLDFFNVSNTPEFDDRLVQRIGRVTWSYNTTNHPFVPTEGTLVTAGPVLAWRDENYLVRITYPDGSFERVVRAAHSTTYGLQATALRYWQLSDRNSVSIGGEAGVGRLQERDHLGNDTSAALYGIAQAGYSVSLWRPEWRGAGGDSRVELIVRGRVRENQLEREREFRRDTDVLQSTLSWVRHSSWGTVRLGVGYAW